ncbi:MAG: hypothetical protein GY833_22240 [Aestuariibacter sp.]|nr:hypothetical protein [Aestuariibacter sp.]|tara:strand:- start:21551 stop:21826 length:276 start_codon:yes stop_codon:yes gene_type:complete
MSNEIRPVDAVFDDGAEWLLACPHCGKIRGIDKEGSLSNLRGEMYQDNLCSGWYELSQDCRASIKTVDQLYAIGEAKERELEEAACEAEES